MRRVLHSTTLSALCTLLLALCLHTRAGAQQQSAPAGDPAEQVKALLARPEVVRALAHIDAGREQILKEWIAITEVNAPSGKERQRAAFQARMTT